MKFEILRSRAPKPVMLTNPLAAKVLGDAREAKAAPTKPKAAAPPPAPLTAAERCNARGERARAALPTPGTIQRPGPRQSAPEVANPDRLAAQIIAAGKRRRGEA